MDDLVAEECLVEMMSSTISNLPSTPSEMCEVYGRGNDEEMGCWMRDEEAVSLVRTRSAR